MKSTWDGNTRGLRDGSYPEPPELTDYDHEPCCAECGWTQDLKKIDGVLLCRDCREKYFLEHCRDRYWEFITGSPEEQRRFAVDWWFDNLPGEVQGEIAFQAFQREFESCLPQVMNLREEEIAGYAKEHAADFLDYIERKSRI